MLSVSERVGLGHVTVLDQWLWGCVGWWALIGWFVGGSGVNEEGGVKKTSVDVRSVGVMNKNCDMFDCL